MWFHQNVAHKEKIGNENFHWRFQMRQSIQEWIKEVLWKTAFKNLLIPLLNTLFQIIHLAIGDTTISGKDSVETLFFFGNLKNQHIIESSCYSKDSISRKNNNELWRNLWKELEMVV